MLRSCRENTDLEVETDGWPSASTAEQHIVETDCRKLLCAVKANASGPIRLERAAHIAFLRSGIAGLSANYSSLDASRPWLIYWILHSLELLGADLTVEEQESCLDTLRRCQNPDGGFGGGPGQLSHLAPTYASVNALAILARDDAYAFIDRAGMLRWMMTLRTADGGFCMHHDGETDVRGAYCAASVAVLLQLPLEALFAGTPAWVARCQTFEGGIAAVPGAEAHGGYAFCGLAALVLLGQPRLLDVHRLTVVRAPLSAAHV